MSSRAARWYACVMAATNLLVGLTLLAMFAINRAYDGANLFVAMFAPLAGTVFAIIAFMWAVAACVCRAGSGLVQLPMPGRTRRSSFAR